MVRANKIQGGQRLSVVGRFPSAAAAASVRAQVVHLHFLFFLYIQAHTLRKREKYTHHWVCWTIPNFNASPKFLKHFNSFLFLRVHCRTRRSTSSWSQRRWGTTCQSYSYVPRATSLGRSTRWKPRSRILIPPARGSLRRWHTCSIEGNGDSSFRPHTI